MLNYLKILLKKKKGNSIRKHFTFLDYKINITNNANSFMYLKDKKEAVQEIQSWAFYKALQQLFD